MQKYLVLEFILWVLIGYWRFFCLIGMLRGRIYGKFRLKKTFLNWEDVDKIFKVINIYIGSEHG